MCAIFYEKGHWKKDSPKLKKKYKDEEVSNACVIERRVILVILSFAQWVIHQTIASFNEWILDMVYTYHMYPNKEWFFNFEEVDSGAVYMGGGDISYIIGMGSI